MSKIRQAVEYERVLTDEKVKAHIELTAAELKAEQEIRALADAYERKYTDGQFGQLQLVAAEHRTFHEREHILYEDAIEKAATALSAAITAIQVDVDRLRDASNGFLTTERFEREHQALSEKTELALKVMADKLGAEERVTVQQTTRDQVLATVKESNTRLLYALIANGLTLAALLAHLFKLY